VRNIYRPIIEVSGLTKVYRMESLEVKTLQDITFQVYPYEFVEVHGTFWFGQAGLNIYSWVPGLSNQWKLLPRWTRSVLFERKCSGGEQE